MLREKDERSQDLLHTIEALREKKERDQDLLRMIEVPNDKLLLSILMTGIAGT